MPQAPMMQVPKYWPLVTQPNNRSSQFTKDSRLVNCYAEKDPDDGFQVEKRFGLGPPAFTLPAGQGMGMYRYSFVGASNASVFHYLLIAKQLTPSTAGIYYTPSPSGLPALIATVNITSSTNPFYFASIPIATATSYLFLTNGAQAVAILSVSGSPFTSLVPISPQSSGGNYPNATVPGVVVLDGTVYVMDFGGNIYGSNLNDPTTWTALNVIQANNEPDAGVALVKQLVYVVAIKEWTTQFYFDNGNPTGSPLSPVPGALLPYGCLAGTTIAEIDGMLLWATSNKTNSAQILLLENLAHKIVSTPAIERQLDLGNPSSVFYAWAIKHGGHRLYILTNKTSNVTLVYDIDQKLWYQWTDFQGNYFPLVSQGVDLAGNHILQHESNGNIYFTDTDNVYSTDNGTVFPVDIYTPNADFQIFRDKVLNTVYFDADMNPGSFIQSRYSDDDFRTYSNFRTTDLSQRRPQLTDEGTFWRRSYHFRHACATPFRITAVGLEMDIAAK